MSLPLPLIDENGYVLQNEDGIYLDDVDVAGEISTVAVVVQGYNAATGDIIYDEDGIPLSGEDGFVLQNEDGIYFDDVDASGIAISSGRVASTGDILYDEGTELLLLSQHLNRFGVAPASRPRQEQPALARLTAHMNVALDDVMTTTASHVRADQIVRLRVYVPPARMDKVWVALKLNKNFTVREADTVLIAANLVDANNQPFDLTGYRVIWQVEAMGQTVVILKTSDDPDQVTLPNVKNGVVRVHLTARDTTIHGRDDCVVYRHALILQNTQERRAVMSGAVQIIRKAA